MPPVEERPNTAALEAIKAAAARRDVKGLSRSGSGAVDGSLRCLLGAGPLTSPPCVIVPSGTLAWPDALSHILATAQGHVAAGFLPPLRTVWLSADNRIYLWNLDADEFTSFAAGGSAIVAVEVIATPPGVFAVQPSHTLVLLASSELTVVGFNKSLSGAVGIVDAGLRVGLDVPLTRITQHEKSGRVFGAGSDGGLYEVLFHGAKVSLVNHTSLFAHTPGLQTLGLVMTGLRRAWTDERDGLVDVVADSGKDTVYTLSASGVVSLWDIPTSSTKATLVSTVPHVPPRASQAGPPRRLFCVHSAAQSTEVVGVAENGDRYVYCPSVSDSLSFGFSSKQSLKLNEFVPSQSTTKSKIIGCFDGVFMCSISDNALGWFAVPSLAQPSVAAREIRTVVPLLPRLTLFDVTELRPQSTLAVTDGLHLPRRLFTLLTSDGVAAFTRITVQDIVHATVAFGGTPPEGLPAGEQAAALIAVAAGISPPTEESSLRGQGQVESDDARRLLALINQPVSPETCRRATRLLREMLAPSVVESRGQRGATIVFSAFASGLVTVIARAVAPIWNEKWFDEKKRTVRLSEAQVDSHLEVLQRVLAFLDATHGDLWQRVPRVEGFTFDHGTAVAQTAVDVSPHTVAEMQNARITDLQYTATVAHQLLRFLRFAIDVSPPVVSRAGRADKEFSTFTLKDLIDRPKRAAAFARQILKVVVEAEQASRLPNYDGWLELFDRMERDCTVLFGSVDVAANHAVIQLDQAVTIRDAHRRAQVISQVVADLQPAALALHEGGSLDAVVTQLVDQHAAAEAIFLCMAAAAQVNPAFPDKKAAIVARATSTLEKVWRDAPSELAPLLDASGPLWRTDPQDQESHFALFRWLLAPRADEVVSFMLRRAFAESGSNWIENYIQRFGSDLDRAAFLRYGKADPARAAEAYLGVAAADLRDVPAADRLRTRLDCLREAAACPEPTTATRAETLKQHVEIQQQLAGIIDTFLRSGNPLLQEQIEVDGRVTTQAQEAQSHRARLEAVVLEPMDLFALAAYYRAVGGADVQLRLLELHRVLDPELIGQTIATAMDVSMNPLDTARMLLQHHNSIAFPLVDMVARLLEDIRTRDNVAQFVVGCGVSVSSLLDAVRFLCQTAASMPIRDAPPHTSQFRRIDADTCLRAYLAAIEYAKDMGADRRIVEHHRRSAQDCAAHCGMR
jgi:hypothetical protein